MKQKKLLVVVTIMAVIVLGLASVSYALANYGSRPEAAAGLTGKSLEEVIDARREGIPYGKQAEAAGVQEAFEEEIQNQFRDRLDALVEEGRLTREEADARIAAMEEHIATCDGESDQTGSGIFGGLGGNGLRDGNGMMNEDRPSDGTGFQEGRGGMGGRRGSDSRGGYGLRDGSGLADGVKSSS